MSLEVPWDAEKYRDEHESDEHWLLRKAFIERWKDNYPEERLLCLARVFCNIELMGCRYPAEVMKEVASLSKEVANSYRNIKKSKLQRTFVSASDAAEDRARGTKREAGIVKDSPASKSSRIEFVKQGESNHLEKPDQDENSDDDVDPEDVKLESPKQDVSSSSAVQDSQAQEKQKTASSCHGIRDCQAYLNELLQLECVDIKTFTESMFETRFGRLVMLVRPWTNKLSIVQASCQACHIPLECTYENQVFTIKLNSVVLAQADGETKQIAKQKVEVIAWDRLKTQVISVLVKEQWIAQGDTRIGVSDVSSKKREEDFGTPIESSVASKMMQLMGWKGGGLGAESQGIAEPIKPHLQMVHRAGLGSSSPDVSELRRCGAVLMRRYAAAASLDLDLVFAADFSKEERAALHQCAQRAGLSSRSYGADVDRFLVVKKKFNPFSIVKGVIEEGGNTAKYQVFIPVALSMQTG